MRDTSAYQDGQMNTDTSKALASLKAKRLLKKVIRLDPVGRAALNPKSLRKAVNACCWQCQGEGHDPGVNDRIRHCEIVSCALHPVRPYQE
jgi:hypothetical protein